MLDKAHSTHIRREVHDAINPVDRLTAGVEEVEIKAQVFRLRKALMPLLDRLYIDCTDLLYALGQKVSSQVPADETASTGNEN